MTNQGLVETDHLHFDPCKNCGVSTFAALFLSAFPVLGNNQHRFNECRSSLTSPVFLYDKVTGIVDTGRAVYVIYLKISQSFCTDFHSIFESKLGLCSLNG